MGRPGCGWPAAGGGALPDEIINLQPADFAPNPDGINQCNPPYIGRYGWTTPTAWFTPCIWFPFDESGGSWAQTTFMTTADADPAIDPYVRIYYGSDATGPNLWFSFDVHMTANQARSAISAGGPGTPTDNMSFGVNRAMITDEIQVPMTGGIGGWGAERVINLNLFRGHRADPPATVTVPVFGVRVRYARL